MITAQGFIHKLKLSQSHSKVRSECILSKIYRESAPEKVSFEKAISFPGLSFTLRSGAGGE